MKQYTNKIIWKHILSAIVLIACIPIVSATPPIPESYWGYATLNGVPAPNGTSITVEVYGTSEVVGNTTVQYPNGGYSLDIIFNDTDTAEDEGADKEDTLTWKINGINCSIPAPGTDTATSGGTNGNFNLTATTTIPTIEFTYVPPLGSFEDLRGKVTSVTPSDHKVAVYIYVLGWWTKPTFADPLTTIQSDGNWTCDITTGGYDQNATKIKAYLIPNSYTPPQMSGGQTLPSELDQNAVTSIEAIRKPERIIQFSGYNWTVKSGEILMGPGPNYFSESNENVWVDQQGQLHLKIVNRDGKWYCAEVYTTESFGHGKYIFYVASRVDQLDKNVVAGLFTWDGAAPEYNYREIDIEFSKWGQSINDNAQYVVQPWDQPENMERFNMELNGNNSTHIFDWSIDSIFFQSLHDHFSLPPDDSCVIESWVYTGDDIPPGGQENVRINLWLNNGEAPFDGQEAEVIIKKFEYTQNDTTSIGSANTPPNSTVTIPLSVANVINISGISFDLLYNSSVVIVSSVSANESFAGSSITQDIDNVNGTTRVALTNSNLISASAETPVIDIAFNITGGSGSSTSLDLKNVTFSDTNFNPYTPAVVVDGQITVRIKGDFNGNGRVDIGDVAKVAFMVAGKVQEDPNADFNGNGRVDIGDAAKIAFYLAGKVSELW